MSIPWDINGLFSREAGSCITRRLKNLIAQTPTGDRRPGRADPRCRRPPRHRRRDPPPRADVRRRHPAAHQRRALNGTPGPDNAPRRAAPAPPGKPTTARPPARPGPAAHRTTSVSQPTSASFRPRARRRRAYGPARPRPRLHPACARRCRRASRHSKKHTFRPETLVAISSALPQ